MDPISRNSITGDWTARDANDTAWAYSDGLWREQAETGATFTPESFLAYAGADSQLSAHTARLHFVMMNVEETGHVNRCVVCGVDLGDRNPRQLCRKTYCPES